MVDGFGSWTETNGGSTGTVRILHVDDNRDFAALTATYLERESEAFTILSEHSAGAGLDRLRTADVDCIVSDYQMPGENGLEFFEGIPDQYAHLPFILFTGQGSEEVASDAFSLGVTDYLQKEVGGDQYTVLANRIEQAVANAQFQRRVELTRERFKTLVEESSDAILVVGPTGKIRYATPATEHVLGRTPDELLGTDGFDPVHDEDVGVVAQELTKLIEDPTYRARVEFRYDHGADEWIWVEVRGRNLLDSDAIDGIVVYVRDIDDRRGRERELQRQTAISQAVFEEALDAMVIADDDGVYVDANRAACELFGLPREELLGRTIAEFTPEEYDFERHWTAFQETDRDHGRLTLVRADGERRLVEFAATREIVPGRHLSILRVIDDVDAPDQ
ncbi:PAS domain S-box protein [Halapricum salinum]|uniref:PAS domain S-box protein n=1 Tax=Halapricum salinum TaxID=1457250 RepID=A0A4D6HFG7_9EURY|nr:PAS domain S-box protein [Halapricum salinum]QCC51792.1 PAS domain S-box protein [Halapricum salinum]